MFCIMPRMVPRWICFASCLGWFQGSVEDSSQQEEAAETSHLRQGSAYSSHNYPQCGSAYLQQLQLSPVWVSLLTAATTIPSVGQLTCSHNYPQCDFPLIFTVFTSIFPKLADQLKASLESMFSVLWSLQVLQACMIGTKIARLFTVL